MIGKAKQLLHLFPTGKSICRHSIEGAGLNPAGGIELQPVAKIRMSSNVVADLPSEKFINQIVKKKSMLHTAIIIDSFPARLGILKGKDFYVHVKLKH